MKKIIFDALGNDNGIKASLEASKAFLEQNQDFQIQLIADKKEVETFAIKHENLIIIDNSVSVDKTKSPKENYKAKNSMNQGIDMLKNNEAQAFLSSGDSASLLFSSSIRLKKFSGIERAAFMPILPTIKKNKKALLLDVGANLNIKAEHLIQWAKFTNVFAQQILDIENPRISILNIGTEDNKGFDFHIEANKQLKEISDLNYIGFLEPREILENKADIILSDGYAGNVALKTIEGTVLSFLKLIKTNLTKTLLRKILATMLRPAFNDIKEYFDYRNVGSAWVIGLNGIIIKTHGSSDKKAYLGALNQIKTFINKNALEKLAKVFSNEKQ